MGNVRWIFDRLSALAFGQAAIGLFTGLLGVSPAEVMTRFFSAPVPPWLDNFWMRAGLFIFGLVLIAMAVVRQHHKYFYARAGDPIKLHRMLGPDIEDYLLRESKWGIDKLIELNLVAAVQLAAKDEFRAQAMRGELRAIGRYPNTPNGVVIPADHWEFLEIEFRNRGHNRSVVRGTMAADNINMPKFYESVGAPLGDVMLIWPKARWYRRLLLHWRRQSFKNIHMAD